MITSLSIKNYALIEDIKVDFSTGLTIITGETGAGKSILLGALGLVLGKRADLKVMRDATKKCVIEAEFAISNYRLEALFETNDLDYESTSILRREILPSGKSRAFINDTPVTLHQMQTLGATLIDVHSQNDTQTLITETYQLQVIDALAANDKWLSYYRSSLDLYKKIERELNALKAEKNQTVKELDYHSFLYNELTQAKLKSLDQKDLEETYEKLNNTEEIQTSFAQIAQLLDTEGSGILAASTEARMALGRIKNFSSDYAALWDRFNSAIIELEDISEEIKTSVENLDADPQLLNEINEKLQNLYNLQQKHTVGTVHDLIAIEETLALKIESSSTIGDRIELLEYELEKKKQETLEYADRLTQNREKAIPKLKRKLEEFLQDLGLPDAQFQFSLTTIDDFRKNGNTSLELLFTANKGMAFGLLHKVASGGEMSRIMLAVKAVLTSYKKLPTLIFDEIDTGVSGEIAHKMAEIMNEMSRNMQVLSITHLPQIAAKGDYHKRVYKAETNGVAHTEIKELNPEERIIEIAQMIGGSSVSDSAIAHAKQLLN